MKKRICIIEDDPAINQGIALALGEEAYSFGHYGSLREVREAKEAELSDLIILDINLPDGNGLDYLTELRRTSQVPVLILTANDTELDEVTGLKLGADDYVTKPFSLMVLRLRVQKILGRNQPVAAYEKRDLYFDFDRLVFTKKQQELELSKTEIRLLKYFVENVGITLSREKLIDYVWQNEQFVDENALSVIIKRLRDKMEDPGEKLIHTVYGIGYVFKWE